MWKLGLTHTPKAWLEGGGLPNHYKETTHLINHRVDNTPPHAQGWTSSVWRNLIWGPNIRWDGSCSDTMLKLVLGLTHTWKDNSTGGGLPSLGLFHSLTRYFYFVKRCKNKSPNLSKVNIDQKLLKKQYAMQWYACLSN